MQVKDGNCKLEKLEKEICLKEEYYEELKKVCEFKLQEIQEQRIEQEETLNDLENDISEKTQELSILTSEVLRLETNYKSLKDKENNLNLEIEAYNHHLEDLKDKYQSQEKKYSIMKKDLEEYKDLVTKNDNIKEEIDNNVFLFIMKEKKITSLNSDIKEQLLKFTNLEEYVNKLSEDECLILKRIEQYEISVYFL